MSIDLLELKNFKYIEAIRSMICDSKAINNAFVVIAHENYLPICKVLCSPNSQAMPIGIEDQILLLEQSMFETKDETPKRRFYWFYIAALVIRATQIADQNLIYRPQAVTIWQSLVDAGTNLKRICESTQIWAQDEKVWFRDLNTEEDGKLYVLSCMAPDWARSLIVM